MIWAHPRSRGENPAFLEVPGKGHWLIPAHAGKTPRDSPTSRRRWAHPRSRGENLPASQALYQPRGSSPLTRGKPLLRGRRTKQLGLIPAHAGKTASPSAPTGTGTAHPRSRGENLIWSLPDATAGGSSPLTRGKLTLCKLGKPNKGLIPAHAGKTCGRYRP